MRSAFRLALLLGVSPALVMGLFACNKQKDANDPSQLGQYNTQQGQYGQTQGQYAQPTATGVATAAPTTTAAPTGGFPCATDNDPQCVFGRCQGGRCGACVSAADCKAGASCVQTPLGMTCMPGMGTK